jgi:hypothetical protein
VRRMWNALLWTAGCGILLPSCVLSLASLYNVFGQSFGLPVMTKDALWVFFAVILVSVPLLIVTCAVLSYKGVLPGTSRRVRKENDGAR